MEEETWLGDTFDYRIPIDVDDYLSIPLKSFSKYT